MFFVFLQNTKANIQNKLTKTNKLHKTNKQGQKPRVCFVLVSSFQTSGPSWSMAHIPHRPCVPPLKKANFFPFVTRNQSQKAFWLGVGLCIYSPFPSWDFVLFELVHVIHVPLQSLSSYVYQLCFVWKAVSLELPITSGSYNHFALSHRSLSLERRSVTKKSSLGLRASKSSVLSTIVQLLNLC